MNYCTAFQHVTPDEVMKFALLNKKSFNEVSYDVSSLVLFVEKTRIMQCREMASSK